MKPTTTNTRYVVATLKRNKGYALLDGETVIGVIMRPKEGKRTWSWAVTFNGSYENGYKVGQQAAMDALVAAYEQTLATDTAGASGNGEAVE